jgi:hypothetical protein
VLLLAVLFGFGVTMLRRQTAVEFAGIQHGHALREFRDQRARAHARRTAPPSPPTIAESAGSNTAPAASSGRVETLERLAALRTNGSITDEEFAAEKAHVMNNGT